MDKELYTRNNVDRIYALLGEIMEITVKLKPYKGLAVAYNPGMKRLFKALEKAENGSK